MSETNVFLGKVWICTSLSLSILLFYKYCELTIFNSFNFVACEFFVRRDLLGILRVFKGCVRNCIPIFCKYIEDRLKKDGVFMVVKRRLFPIKRRVSGAKTKSFESKDFVFFRKNAVFSSVVLDFVLRKMPFGENKTRNT